MRWGNLDTAYTFAQANTMKFNFHVLVWGNQQPTWMAALPAEEQLVEIKKWFAAVAERYPKIEWLQVVNEPLHDPPDCTHSANQGNNCNASGNYARALGGANGTDGTGWDWILNAFRLAKQYFPNTKLMLNDYSITNSDSATTQYLQIINILKRENLIDVVGEQGHAFSTTGNMAQHKANLDRLAATGVKLQITELDIDGVAAGGVPGRRGAAAQLPPHRPGVLGAPERRGRHGLGLAPAQPLAQRAERADRALRRHAQARRAVAVRLRARHRADDPGRPARSRSTTSTRRSARSRPRTGPRRSTARTCARSPGGSPAATTPACSPSPRPPDELTVAKPQLLDELTTYTLKVRVSDGFHESAETDVAVVTGDLANVVDGAAGGTVPATLALTLGAPASFGPFTPGVAQEYTASSTATVTSTAGDAALTRVGDHAGQRRVPAGTAGHDHAGEDELERPREQRHVRDRVQAEHRTHGGAAHRRLHRDRDLHAVDDDAVMKLRMTALALVASAVVGGARRRPGPRRALPVRRDERHGRQRPLRHRAPRGRSSTATPPRSGTPDADSTLPGGNGGTAPAVRLPDGLLAGLDDVTIAYDVRLSSTTAGARVRVRSHGGQRRLADRHAGRRGRPRTRRRSPVRVPAAAVQTAAAPVSLLANTWIHVAVTVKGGDVTAPGQLRLYEDGAADDVQRRADGQAARHHVGRRLRRPLEHRGGTAVPGPDQGPPHLLRGC